MSKLVIPLGDDRKRKLRQLAAKRTLATDESCDMTKLILEAVDALIDGATSTDGDSPTPGPSAVNVIRFKPLPEVASAIRRAQAHSGAKTDQVINSLLVDALQMEVTP